MGTNPSSLQGPNLPVSGINWFDAIEYCNRRSQKEGLTPAYSIRGTGNSRSATWNRNANGYRLPTEAEWEFACRAGTTTPFSIGNNATTDQANYDGSNPYNNNAAGEYRRRPLAIGSFGQNPWGLHDMHGNVFEWCWDLYGTYMSSAQTNPIGAAFGTERILRGGAWSSRGLNIRSAYRFNASPANANPIYGFRLAQNAN